MTQSVSPECVSREPVRSPLIGLVFDASNPFEADLVDAVYAAADARAVAESAAGQSHPRYRIASSIHGRARNRARAIADLVDVDCDALIVVGATHDDALDLPLPTVIIGERIADLPALTIGTDEWQGAHLAVQHLIDLGHSAITHIGGGDHPCAAERQRGYIGAMTAAGLQQNCQILRGDYTEEAGARVARELLDRLPRPTAVFLANDRMAFGFIDVMRAHGVSVPAEMSVVGYDDGHLAGVDGVDLTTIRQDIGGLAAAAIDAVGRVLTDDSVEPGGCGFLGDVALEPELIVRATTAAPKRRRRPPRERDEPRLRWGLMVEHLDDTVMNSLADPALVSGSIEVVASASTMNAWQIADRLGILASYGLYGDLLDDPDIDAVLIALDDDLADEWALRSAAAGKQVRRIVSSTDRPVALPQLKGIP
ncbi:substrate-binding domain-containing protein [Gordonia sp. VNQ95]|uniref:LacI family DNA-binding transcriptional regulator n=1 Tax=Gordonia TaxID=2053 RepID=UPI0032B3D2D7